MKYAILRLLLCCLFVVYEAIMSFGYVKMLRMFEYKCPWFGYIPFVRDYAAGDVVVSDESHIAVGKVNVPGFVFQFYWLPLPLFLMCGQVGFWLMFWLKTFAAGTVYGRLFAAMDKTLYADRAIYGYFCGLVRPFAAVKFLAADDNLRK